MKVCIVIQSKAFLASAGMRIRYNRFMQAVDSSVATFEAVVIDELRASRNLDGDIYIFSKCFTADVQILACVLKSLGKIVGHDIFDDYFSQFRDTRLGRYRSWLRSMAPWTDFVICTTERMRVILEEYFPETPITVISDPVEAFDPILIDYAGSKKTQRMLTSRQISIVWFGIGDNPFFPVGIRDLVAYGGELARFQRLGWQVTLEIVTNTRALSAVGLHDLRKLPCPYRVHEWSEQSEAEALAAADVAFIPVNMQSFSRAKSLNRAITALGHGCQILSNGYPLYEALESFVYRSSHELIGDLQTGSVKLRTDTVPALTAFVSTAANPYRLGLSFVDAASRALAKGASRQRSKGPIQKGKRPRFCVVHGMESPTENHKLANRLGGLSVKGPFNNGRLNFHVRFDLSDHGLDVLVEKSRATLLPPTIQSVARETEKILDHEFIRVPPEALGIRAGMPVYSMHQASLPARVAVYRTATEQVIAGCRALFVGIPVLLVENNGIVPRTL